MRFPVVVVYGILAGMLCGCCGGPATEEDSLGPVHAITTFADVRSFYVKKDKSQPDYGRFVAEPSPDAFANFTQSLSVLAKASEGKDLGTAELQLLSQITREAVRLGVRSQGVIYLRDATYRLAEAYMNKAFFPKASAKDSEPQGAKTALPLIGLAGVSESEREVLKQLANSRDLDARTLEAAFESWSYQQQFRRILDNAKELILHELDRNPTLSSSLTSTSARSAAIEIPRTAVTFEAKDGKLSATITFTNRELANVDINIEVNLDDKEKKSIEKRVLRIALGKAGTGFVVAEIPATAHRMIVTAPTSTRLDVAVPSAK